MSHDPGYHFTDEEAQIYSGEEARRRLQEVDEARFLSADGGIVQVSQERWQAAQRFERKGWMEKWRGAADDRNYDHMAGFDGYRVLRGRTFAGAVELGCGPFTNTRLIGGRCRIREISLLDPLIESYLTLETASYDRTSLKAANRLAQWGAPGGSVARRAVRKTCRIFPALGRTTIPVKEIFPTAIENMPARPQAYDLVILINVIEHCFDLPKIFEKILEMSRPGACFVFHDHLYEHKVVAEMVQGRHYEAGHPLMADYRVVERFCRENFEPLFERRATAPIGDHPILKEHRTYYFIGRRRDS